jgi:hypothetical protein
MRAGCAASNFFQFLVGYGENEKVDGVIAWGCSSMETAPAPAPSHSCQHRFEHNPHTRMAGSVWLGGHEVFGIDRQEISRLSSASNEQNYA